MKHLLQTRNLMQTQAFTTHFGGMPYKDIRNGISSGSSSNKTVSVSSNTTITVSGVESPAATADRVARTQQNTNAVLVRNTGNVVR